MTGHVPLDYGAVRFAADMESMRATAAQIFAHPNRGHISPAHALSDLEEHLWFETGICPPALWPTDVAAQVLNAWKSAP